MAFMRAPPGLPDGPCPGHIKATHDTKKDHMLKIKNGSVYAKNIMNHPRLRARTK